MLLFHRHNVAPISALVACALHHDVHVLTALNYVNFHLSFFECSGFGQKTANSWSVCQLHSLVLHLIRVG
jgi:hypothetical protein